MPAGIDPGKGLATELIEELERQECQCGGPGVVGKNLPAILDLRDPT